MWIELLRFLNGAQRGALSSLTSTTIMTSEEKKERLSRLRAIRGAQRSIVTKNVSKVNDIVEDEALIYVFFWRASSTSGGYRWFA